MRKNILKIIIGTISILALILMSLNSFFYPTLTIRYLGINSLNIFFGYSVIILVLALFKLDFYPNFIIWINKKMFPVLVLITTFLLFLENIQYPNFVLKYLHIFPYSFFYIALFSGIIYFVSVFKAKNKNDIFLYVGPLLLVFLLGLFQFNYFDSFKTLVKEDSVLEYIQFGAYLLAGYFALKTSFLYKNKKRLYCVLFFIFSLLMFLIAFEEISWGQRIFGINTPESLKVKNLQKETNFHNLYLFQYDRTYIAYILIGLYGAFSRFIVTKFFPKKLKKIVIFTPHNYLFVYFFIISIVYFDRLFLNLYYDITLYRRIYLFSWQEVAESYLAIGFLIYIFSTYKESLNNCER